MCLFYKPKRYIIRFLYKYFKMIVKILNKFAGWFGLKLIEKKLYKNNRLIDKSSAMKVEEVISILYQNNMISKIVQIGSNDGLRFDVLRSFLINYKTRALLVEPIPEQFEKLEKNYKNIDYISLENSAITLKNSDNKMFQLNPKYTKKYSDHVPGISSLSKKHLIKHGVKRQHIMSKKVNTISITELLKKHNFLDFDLFYIDAEGYDGEIILDYFKNLNERPIIIFEYIHIDHKKFEQVIKILGDKKYKFLRLNENVIAFNQQLNLKL